MPLLGKGTMIRPGRDLPAWPFVDLATWHRIHTIAEPKNLTALRQLQVETGGSPLFERYIQVARDQSGHLIAKQTEDAKIQLSAESEATIDLNVVEAGLRARARRDRFEACIAGDVGRIKVRFTPASVCLTATATLPLAHPRRRPSEAGGCQCQVRRRRSRAPSGPEARCRGAAGAKVRHRAQRRPDRRYSRHAPRPAQGVRRAGRG